MLRMDIISRIYLSVLFSVALFTLCSTSCLAQSELDLVGKMVPEHQFQRVKNLRKEHGVEKVSIDELRGKWLLLYFWTRSCTPCINSFPKLAKIQKKFKPEVQVLLVGINDMYNRQTEGFFEGVKAVQGIDLAIAYDTSLVRKLQIIYASTVVNVDPNGMIESVSTGKELSVRNIRRMLRRKKSAEGGA